MKEEAEEDRKEKKNILEVKAAAAASNATRKGENFRDE